MKAFTVLLLYPDHVAETFGHETYLDHRLAKDAKTAIFRAQKTRAEEHNTDLDDWHCLACFEGHLDDVNPGSGMH